MCLNLEYEQLRVEYDRRLEKDLDMSALRNLQVQLKQKLLEIRKLDRQFPHQKIP